MRQGITLFQAEHFRLSLVWYFNGFEGKFRDLKELYVVLRDWDLIEFKQILLGFEGLGRIVRNVKGS